MAEFALEIYPHGCLLPLEIVYDRIRLPYDVGSLSVPPVTSAKTGQVAPSINTSISIPAPT